MREMTFISVDRIDADILQGLNPMLQITVVERVGKHEVATTINLVFNDEPGTDELIHDLAEGIGTIMETHKPRPTAQIVPLRRREGM